MLEMEDTLGWKAPCKLELSVPDGPGRSEAKAGLYPGSNWRQNNKEHVVSKGDSGPLNLFKIQYSSPLLTTISNIV